MGMMRFLHVDVSKPGQDYVLHFLCGLYPDAVGIHSVSLRHKLETSGLFKVPSKYNGPSFDDTTGQQQTFKQFMNMIMMIKVTVTCLFFKQFVVDFF
ncbi:putative mitochondrial glycoprotein superfamily [Helianthus annuus]|nr:putative mitochondrial glycoprotein superfamily [Helianthus annuus]